jgi:hypothetical protein
VCNDLWQKLHSFTRKRLTKGIFFGTFRKKCAKILAESQKYVYICTQKRDSA